MTDQPTDPLTFDEFPEPTYDEWRATTEKSLKGADFDRKLKTRTDEGITLNPLYFRADIDGIDHVHTLPGDFPYMRGTRAEGDLVSPWWVAQAIQYPTPEAFNVALRHDLEHGQTAVNLVLDAPSRAGNDPAPGLSVGQDGVSVSCLADLALALDGIDLKTTPVIIHAGTSSVAFAAFLKGLADIQTVPTDSLHGWINVDPLGELARKGDSVDLAQLYDEMAMLVTWAAQYAPKLAVIGVDTTPYADGGASANLDIAYALATGAATIRAMTERGLDVDTVARAMVFRFAIGGNFFMEIAKLRAARMLWAQVVTAFGGSEDAARMTIHAHTGRFNKTITDPYVNMLRTTTEALSGAIGGADSLHVDPFDAVIRPPDEFSRRIARNQQIILQEEVNLTQVIDPAGGSWYVEKLTDDLARSAWAAFQAVEAEGGMLAALEKGLPQQQVADVADARSKTLATRKHALVGTNMYANLGETPVKSDDTDYAALATKRQKAVGAGKEDRAFTVTNMDEAIQAAKDGATLEQIVTAMRGDAETVSMAPVNAVRLSSPFERLRANALIAAQDGAPPSIFLATMGPLAKHKARADFTQGFFSVGGFEVVYPDGFDSVEAAAAAVQAEGVPAVVICGTDEDYAEVVEPLAQAIKSANSETVVILAGYPKDKIDDYRAAGVDEFIHIKADCLAINQWLQGKMGISK